MPSSNQPTLAEAKERIDDIIKKARVDLYKPIQIAEVLYRGWLRCVNCGCKHMKHNLAALHRQQRRAETAGMASRYASNRPVSSGCLH